jgi:uncharacterized membrane protein YhaH (DUF805 family)
MLFRWFMSVVIIGVVGILVQNVSEEGQDLAYACVGFPIYAFMLFTGIKRSHDMGYSAWGFILLSLLPLLFLLPGDKRSNKYGPKPTRWL